MVAWLANMYVHSSLVNYFFCHFMHNFAKNIFAIFFMLCSFKQLSKIVIFYTGKFPGWNILYKEYLKTMLDAGMYHVPMYILLPT